MAMNSPSKNQEQLRPMSFGFPGCGADGSFSEAFSMPTAESTLFGLLFLGAKGAAELVLPSIYDLHLEGIEPPDNAEALHYWRCVVETPLGTFSCLHRGVAHNKQSRPPTIIELIDDLTCEAGMIEMYPDLEAVIAAGAPADTEESLRLDIRRASRAEESLVAALGPFREANFTSKSTVVVAEEACSDRPELKLPGVEKPFGLLELAAAEGSDELFSRILEATIEAGPLGDGRLRRMEQTLSTLGLCREARERIAAIEAAEIETITAPTSIKRRLAL